MNFKRKAIYKILNSMAEKQLDKNGNMKKAGPQIVEPKKGGVAKTSEFLKDVGATLASYIITTKDLDAIREYMLENPLPEDASKADKNKSAIVALAIESISLMKHQRTKEYKKHLESIAEAERAKQQPITDTIKDENYDSTTPVDSELDQEIMIEDVEFMKKREETLLKREILLSPSNAPLNLEDTNTRNTNNDNRDTRGRN